MLCLPIAGQALCLPETGQVLCLPVAERALGVPEAGQVLHLPEAGLVYVLNAGTGGSLPECRGTWLSGWPLRRGCWHLFL